MPAFTRTIESIKQALSSPQGILKEVKLRCAKGAEVVIFGAGNCGHSVYGLLKSYHVQGMIFCDNHLKGSMDGVTGLPVVGMEDLLQDKEKYLVLVSVADVPVYDEIAAQLLQNGFEDTQIYCMCPYFERLPLDFLTENEQSYRCAYDSFADEFSRKVFLAKMRYVYLAEPIADVAGSEKDEYFDDHIVLTDDEVFVDCGGYDGDSALEFLERTQGRYKKILIFEPEKSKEERIRNNLGNARYQLFMKGIWNEDADLFFEAKNNPASCISSVEGNGTKVEVVALDNVIYDEHPTYIKMDIEGAEKMALLGGEKIIRDFKPKLAVCVYHKPEDLFELPLLIKKLNPDYQLYLRHYSEGLFQTICYAVSGIC